MSTPKYYITYGSQVGGLMVIVSCNHTHKEHFQRSVKHVEATLIINENGHEGLVCSC